MEITPLESYLNAARDLAFNHLQKQKKYIEQLHALLSVPEHEQNAEWLEQILTLMTLPSTLQGSDFKGIAKHMLDQLAETGTIDARHKRILRNYKEIPGEELIQYIAEDELQVEAGNYDQYLRPEAQPKFDAKEKEILDNPQVHADIAEFFRENPGFAGRRKILRRRLSKERGYHADDFDYDRTNPRNVSQTEFDSLCKAHHLIGVEITKEGYKPLVQKLCVNTTPFGIMIFIPSYWSLDPARDINWKEICKILRAWGVKRQGAKLSYMRIDARERTKRVYDAWVQVTADGLRGKDRYTAVKKIAKLHPDTDEGTINKMVKEGKLLLLQ